MSDSVLLQDLLVVSRDLWKLKSHLRAAWRHTQLESAARGDVEELQKVLAALHDEVFKLIAQERGNVPNQRNDRPGSDLALKAQLAKARQAVADVLNEREDDPSHK